MDPILHTLNMTKPELRDRCDIEYLKRILLVNGRVVPLPAGAYKDINPAHLQQFCVDHARYVIPTQELVGWLEGRICGRRAIEIGAGMGDLGVLLNIQMTDSYVQVTRPEVQMYYALFGQQVSSPPPDVARYEASEAVRRYNPQVVVGAFITQKEVAGDDTAMIGSSVYGVDEFDVIAHCETYIMIGNEAVHKDKRILSLPHETYKPWWLVSRGRDRSANVIWVWDRK